MSSALERIPHGTPAVPTVVAVLADPPRATTSFAEPRHVVRAGTLAIWQVSIIVALIVGHLVTQWVSIRTGRPYIFGLVPMFNLDQEGNLPSYFQALTLLACSLMLLQLHALERRRSASDARPWLILGLVFAYLSVDEAAFLHEALGWMTMWLLGTGFVAYAWVLPIGVAALALGIYLLRFLLRLPRGLAALMILSGAIFVGGAVGVEILAWDNGGPGTMTYAVLTAIEEGMEMIGAAFFLQILIRYAASQPDGGRGCVEFRSS